MPHDDADMLTLKESRYHLQIRFRKLNARKVHISPSGRISHGKKRRKREKFSRMSHYGWQIVEINDSGLTLVKSRGFFQVLKDKQKIGEIALDEISTVLISTSGCLISTVLVEHLCQRNIPIVMCGNNFVPVNLTLPIQGNSSQFQVMKSQMSLSEPRRKKAWQNVVKSKIKNQAEVLERIGQDNQQLLWLSKHVKSGDPDNYEAQAARIYWPLLFGKDFRRNRDKPGLNGMINYIYAITRACVARGVSASGLHPSLGIHHKNPRNAFNLVDDLFEPFRPIADLLLWSKQDIGDDLTPDVKKEIAKITSLPVPLNREVSPLSLATVKMSRSFVDYCQKNSNELMLPDLPMPIDIDRGIEIMKFPSLSAYRIMWIFIMFDLPVTTKPERKEASAFRNYLLDLGFEMSQFSVYLKFCASS